VECGICKIREVETLDRPQDFCGFAARRIDVLIGIKKICSAKSLDLYPEVSLVAILDADQRK